MTLKRFHPTRATCSHVRRLRVLCIAWALCVSTVSAQYIGFVYPAGGQRGTTFRVTIGGQTLQGVDGAFVSGSGVEAKLIEYNKQMSNQEVQILNEQVLEFKSLPPEQMDETTSNKMSRIAGLLRSNAQTPACASIANLAIVEVTIAPDAEVGQREIRISTPRGVSNPLVFYVGQLPEISAEPLATCQLVTLGKEEQSLRKKTREPKSGDSEMMMEEEPMMRMGSAGAPSALDDEEVCITLPCTLNGQIAQGSVDRYSFTAKKGQKMVVVVKARELVPYMADAVPGWFQPVLVLCDAKGKEVAYVDDYLFNPDPVMLCEIPEDGPYHLAIYDSIFRGREDFVYRMTVGELPFITSLFPLGTRVGERVTAEVKGWNMEETHVKPDVGSKTPGVYPVTVRGKGGLLLSNPMPFAVDTLPNVLEKEPNSQLRTAQSITLPVIINGRIDNPGRKDLFKFSGRAGQEIVAEVTARRLQSPLDAVLKLTDAAGKILAANDDREDAASGVNTHHADSYLHVTLPVDGLYYVHLNDTQDKSGEAYRYRLRISEPQPDFALRLVPSMVAIRSNATTTIKAFALRQDGFTNTITFQIKGATNGFSATGKITGTQAVTQVTIKTTLGETREPAVLAIEGVASEGQQTWTREAVPSEDRMQAFLWRHLVPAQELMAVVYNPPPPPPKKVAQKEPPKPEQPKINFPQGLMMHFNFDQWEANNTITDRTGRNNAGRATNGAKWNSAGKQSGGFIFSPSNGCIQVKNSPTLNSKTVTVAAWFKTSQQTDGDRYLFEKRRDNGFALALAGASETPEHKGKLRFVVNNQTCLGESNLADGAWHHATAVFDGDRLKLFVDGRLQKNVTAWKGDVGANTNSLSIGMNGTGSSSLEKRTGFGGLMDDVMLFDHAIRDEEVGAVIASTRPKFSKGQVASRLAQLKELLDRGLLAQAFYDRKVKECEVTP